MPGDGIAAPHEPSAAPPEPFAAPDAAAVAALVETVRGLAAGGGRDDLATRLSDVGRRLDRSDTVVCVVGEFKQGKSALINALLGADVCPVDDDLATTTVTTIGYGPAARATVHRREAGLEVSAAVALEDLAAWVTERADPDDRLGVERVELTLPHPLLARGITLIDTPGIGGLNAAHAAATLAFLPVADALVFVTDASAELTLPELGFLATAVDAGPLIVVALTKIDMYPEWRRILDIDERRLRDVELAIRPHPLSAVLRTAAVALDDPVLERDSGFTPFSDTVLGEVARRARATSSAAAFREVRSAVDQIREPLSVEQGALQRPETAVRMADDLARVRAHLGQLEDARSHWSVRLDDEFGALRARVAFTFAGEMRRILRETQDEIERIDPGREWPDLSGRIQARVAGAVKAAFLEATDGATAIQATVARLLADDEKGWSADSPPHSFDPASLWTDDQAFEGMLRTGVLAGFGLLAGATVGVEMLGMLGALLGTALVGPALLGAVLFFGGREVAGERRRQLTDRRQQAREFVGQFVENVRFEVDGRLASLTGTLQLDMRTRFTARIAELGRTYQATAASIERGIEGETSARQQRSSEVTAELEALDALTARTDALEGGATRAA